MKYQKFLQTIQKEVRQQIGVDYQVKLNSVIKNNDQNLDVITIVGMNNISPNIYLNSYYEEFSSGKDTASIVQDIISIFNGNKNLKSAINILNYNLVSNQITYMLVNFKENKERLKKLPHKVINDLAKIYCIVVKQDNQGISSITVTNDLMKKWGVNINTIDYVAYENTPFLFPKTIRSMKDIIKDMIFEKLPITVQQGIEVEEVSQQDLDYFSENMFSNENEMYVLSNSIGINGASALLYPEVLHNFAIEHKSNFYILPSSIHEVILLPDVNKLSKKELRQMVIDINNSEVAPDEVLSNEIYYFDMESDVFHIVLDE